MQTAWTRVVRLASTLAACGAWACGGAKTSYDALFVRVEAQAGLLLDQVRFSVIQAVDGKRDVVPRDPEQFSAYTFATGGRDLASDPLVVKLLVGTRFQGPVTIVALGFQGTKVAARGVVDADLREKREARLTLRGWPDGCDQDADGFPDCASAGCCEAGERFADCNDSEARATPVGYEDDCTRCGFGEALVGDGVDDDCDGTPARCRDQDGDQAIECLPAWCQEGGESQGSQTCRGREASLDCDPSDATVFPGAPELCDGLDNDCDGQTDEEITFRDWDGAVRALGEPCGTGACAGGVVECDPETKKARCSKAGLAAPAEVCGNQVDDNCNGATDDPVQDGCEQKDTDGDGVQDWIEDEYCGPLAKYHAEVFPEYDAVSRPEVPQGVKHKGQEPCCCGHDGTGACPELCDLDCDGACEGCGTTDADCDGFPASVDCNDAGATVHPGAPEKCGDGVDQDCKGGDQPCTVGADADKDGFLAGLGDCDDSDEGVHPWATEVCNGRDDDCDGVVDDGNPGGQDEPCGSDVGECEKGTMACTHAEGQAPTVACRDDTGPADEECDGKDNDCDDLTDEDFFYDEATGGTCRGDEASCFGKRGVTQTCDGIGECGEGVVECLAPPSLQVTCSSNRDGSAPQVVAEACNNADDDCDGQTDEDLTDVQQSDCLNTGVCGGEGHAAIQAVCHAGKWSCDYSKVPGYEAHPEKSCDDEDNDCDGETDEDFTYSDAVHPEPVKKGAGCGTGACANGTVVCGPDQKGLVCDTSQQQASEVCDGLDNDCDGLVDEDFQYGGKTVYVDPSDPAKGRNACTGVGECGTVPGQVECASHTEATCSTNPNGSAHQDKPETCNNKDDDCDGPTDENLTNVQDSTCKKVGVCLTGIDKIKAKCEAGQWTCNYSQVPFYEAGAEKSCDALDNDCNGQTDEDFQFTDFDGSKKLKGEVCGTGLCAGGQVVCQADKKGLICSSAGQAKAESCNNVDDDCDGLTDDGLTSVQMSDCKKVGVCLAGMNKIAAVCNAGKWFCDYGQVPGYEAETEKSCDALDNDCDGQTDEDFEYTDWDGTKKKKGAACGTGLCQGGTVVCKADLSGVTCSTASLAKSETCDGTDQNCNGSTDEGTDSQCSDGKTCTDDKCQGGQCKNNLLAGNCLIEGTCYTEGTRNPANDCQACLTAQSQTAWSNRSAGSSCNDNVFCNGTDTCDGSGSCANHSGNPCPGQDQGPLCNDSCNEALDNCSGNDKAGTTCDDGVFCNGTDTCNASGSCANHAGNPCPGHDTGLLCNDSCNEGAEDCTGFDATGTPCDDGNACTKDDQCNGGGSCQGILYSCEDNAPCTVDTCLGDGGCAYAVADYYCEIPQGSKNCVPINATKPDNACLACLPAQSQTAWSPLPPSTGCNDGDACTIGDHCDNGTCAGTALVCEAWNPTCSEGECYCDVGPPAVQCDGATSDSCASGTCQCGSNPACDPTSKNPTCSGGTCKCGSTVCDDRSDRCTDSQCKCGDAAPCGVGKVCCNGTCEQSC